VAEALDLDRRLADVAARASDGDVLAAIDELVQLNRTRRDPRTERLLVEMRHAAFAELPVAPGRPVWPASFDDPFPNEDWLPIATAKQLSGDLLGGAITHHGCLCVQGLLDQESAGRLREQIDRCFEGREQVISGQAAESDWFVPFQPGLAKAQGFAGNKFVRAVDAPRALWDLMEIFTERGIIRAVTEYLGERPAMIANKWVLRRSPAGVAGTDFHQDGAFLGDGIRTVDCWIALSDCGPGTGRPAIELIPRRFDQILPTGGDATLGWSIAEAVALEAAGDVPLCSPVFAPGDAMFFDEMLPHRTTQGPDLGRRYAVESWFVAPSSYPAKHVPIVL
jgi:hypothetical protein